MPPLSPFAITTNGNGSLADETAVTAPVNGGVLVTGLLPDATGKIIGNADTPGGETNWSGFQLFIPASGGPPAFDPGSYSPGLEKRRLMDEFAYGDSGKWPVAPEVGYRSATVFSRAFARCVGMTPSQ